MPRAEVGSTKYLSNKLKSKGLQRLRWYCQACERQMRDENGFKCHVQSESHVRQMLVIGEDPKKHINNYSEQFKRDFIQLLKTSHSTKAVQVNHFYQEYIANKEHVHMNATRWQSLTEFAKYLGKEGICRVEEDEKGLHIAWVDNSPDALRRQHAIRKKERMDKGDEEREQKMIEDQVKRAQADVKTDVEETDKSKELQRTEGEKLTLSFGSKLVSNPLQSSSNNERKGTESNMASQKPAGDIAAENKLAEPETSKPNGEASTPVKITFGAKTPQPGNVFSKKNPLAGKKHTAAEQPKKMSEAERIMKQELERKRTGDSRSFPNPGAKRQKVS